MRFCLHGLYNVPRWGGMTSKGDIMGSRWALIASFALALFAAGEVQAQSETQADTQWDRKGEVIEDRPGEYRTNSLDTFIRLTPYFGGMFFDGGAYITPGFVEGFALEFEPADIMICSIDFSSHLMGWHRLFAGQQARDKTAEHWFRDDFEGEFNDRLKSRYQVEPYERAMGEMYHPALYVGLKNPELFWGSMQPILGLGFGAIMLKRYHGDVEPLGAGGLVVPGFEVADRTIYHATIFLRLDFDISDSFKLGFNFKNHILFYNSGDEFLGNMENGTFGLDNLHYAFEPSFYVSIAF